VYIRDGDDLHFSVSVPMIDAALGTKVEVDAILDGPTAIDVAPGTQPGAVTTLRGHGMPNVRTGVRGNLHAHIEVVVPSRLDQQDTELLQKLKEHRVRDVAEVKSTQAAPSGGGLFSRLRETFTGR
jgi:molecular chaperone DnaJ